ncbi:hypothetical protein RhiirA1_442887 [Rhizophagus irregularis]|uniref:Uncharacterized protein n=1 Tax=Rhizophagus irregularis TaxID=588596 RepID=A0A2I1EBA3_9GLOM|nr:hypothetical protein RhiirA1_442887 [Rhizophagus irregularis]PKY19409.1 hypothetical protein RhiirB3_469152 [Rhizophagus irregularis]UZO11515.1 hypothetical protein OCT59_003080 [Rhizophagus irregularis]CAB4481294.1 unnamed protein product [Rhizophagus irregularis]CAB5197524.1 unnamed protein product [Rhizophagus irregularis]
MYTGKFHREELGSFDTVNLNSSNFNSYSLNGILKIGEFSEDPTTLPCTLNKPHTQETITVLLIRFDEAMTNRGCSSYSDIIQSNEWLQHIYTVQTTIPVSETKNETRKSLLNSPPIIIFTSMNEDPGIRENYGNIDILSKSESRLALIRVSDAIQISDLEPQISFVKYIPESGPWIRLFQSKEWKIWLIFFEMFYSSVAILTFSSFIFAIKNYKYNYTNPRLWLFIAILSYTFIFLVMLGYDPWPIHLSEFYYEIIFMAGYYILCLCYAIYLFPWIKATRNLTEVVKYNITFVHKLSRIFQGGTVLAILIKTASIIFYLLQFSPKEIKISIMILNVIFITLEVLFCMIVITTFGTFGIIIVFARIHEQKTRRRSRERRPAGSRKSVRKEIFLSGILTILVIISLLFLTFQKVSRLFLPISIKSFWIMRTMNDVSNIFSSLVLITGLYSNTIGKYSHMIYTGSSDENITTSTVSDNSINNVNAIISNDIINYDTNNNDNINVITTTATTSGRNKRSTIEVLFGRNSLGL